MLHLLSHTVYEGPALLGEDPEATLEAIGADGLEILTSYTEPDPFYKGIAKSVHLPYATDWLAAWEGRPYDMDDDYSRFYMFGRDRGDVLSSVSDAISYAADLEPAYGVFHAGNGDLRDLMSRKQRMDDSKVLDALCEMMNTVVSGMPGGEPPFTILFENLWWPGLKLLDDSGFRILERRLEFDDWGFCLDTGHMMNALPGIESQSDVIEAMGRVFSGYSSDLVDRIETMHLHWSASYGYRSTFEEREPGDDMLAFISEAFDHINRIDQHLPFTDPRVVELVGMLEPSYVTHEMPGSRPGMLDDFRTQRSLFP